MFIDLDRVEIQGVLLILNKFFINPRREIRSRSKKINKAPFLTKEEQSIRDSCEWSWIPALRACERAR